MPSGEDSRVMPLPFVRSLLEPIEGTAFAGQVLRETRQLRGFPPGLVANMGPGDRQPLYFPDPADSIRGR